MAAPAAVAVPVPSVAADRKGSDVKVPDDDDVRMGAAAAGGRRRGGAGAGGGGGGGRGDQRVPLEPVPSVHKTMAAHPSVPAGLKWKDVIAILRGVPANQDNPRELPHPIGLQSIPVLPDRRRDRGESVDDTSTEDDPVLYDVGTSDDQNLILEWDILITTPHMAARNHYNPPQDATIGTEFTVSATFNKMRQSECLAARVVGWATKTGHNPYGNGSLNGLPVFTMNVVGPHGGINTSPDEVFMAGDLIGYRLPSVTHPGGMEAATTKTSLPIRWELDSYKRDTQTRLVRFKPEPFVVNAVGVSERVSHILEVMDWSLAGFSGHGGDLPNITHYNPGAAFADCNRMLNASNSRSEVIGSGAPVGLMPGFSALVRYHQLNFAVWMLNPDLEAENFAEYTDNATKDLHKAAGELLARRRDLRLVVFAAQAGTLLNKIYAAVSASDGFISKISKAGEGAWNHKIIDATGDMPGRLSHHTSFISVCKDAIVQSTNACAVAMACSSSQPGERLTSLHF